MAGGTPRRHGLSVHGAGFAWSAVDPGPEVCCVWPLRSYSGAVIRVGRVATPQRQRRCGRGSGADCTYPRSERIKAKVLPANPTQHTPWTLGDIACAS